MNEKLESFLKHIKGKKVGFLGVGVSNIPVMKLLSRYGALIVARDKNEAVLKKIEIGRAHV